MSSRIAGCARLIVLEVMCTPLRQLRHFGGSPAYRAGARLGTPLEQIFRGADRGHSLECAATTNFELGGVRLEEVESRVARGRPGRNLRAGRKRAFQAPGACDV